MLELAADRVCARTVKRCIAVHFSKLHDHSPPRYMMETIVTYRKRRSYYILMYLHIPKVEIVHFTACTFVLLLTCIFEWSTAEYVGGTCEIYLIFHTLQVPFYMQSARLISTHVDIYTQHKT